MKSSSFWNNVSEASWRRVPVPWKPGWCDLAVYLLFITRYSLFSKHPILLLGATKELRSLISFLNVTYDLVDTSTHMEAITRPKGNDSLRHFLNTKWEDFNSTEKYSLAVGDLILNLCPENTVYEILNKAHDHPLLVRTRLPTNLTYEKVLCSIRKTVTLKGLNKERFFYSLLANIQTLTLVFKKKEEESLSLAFVNQNDSRKKVFQDYYLRYSPEYFLHKETVLKNNSKNHKIYTWFVRKHAHYVDPFCFLIQTNKQ